MPMHRITIQIAIGVLVSLFPFAAKHAMSQEKKTLDFYGVIDNSEHPPGYRDFVEMGCWQCHGFQGKGGEDGPALAPGTLPYEAFEMLVRKPKNVMPAYSHGILSEARLRNIHRYLSAVPPGLDADSIPMLSGGK